MRESYRELVCADILQVSEAKTVERSGSRPTQLK